METASGTLSCLVPPAAKVKDAVTIMVRPEDVALRMPGAAEPGQNLLEGRVVAAVFLGEYPKWLAEMRSALAAGDAPRLELTAHTLKGSLTLFAAKTAAAAALRLETLGREGNLAAAGEALGAVVDEVERLRPILAAVARPVRDLAALRTQG